MVQVLFQIGLVALGSAVGGLARWGVGLAFIRLFGTGFPWGTLFINVTGSFILGWFVTFFHGKFPTLHLLIAVGFTGGFTTFSAFELDGLKLFTNDSPWWAIFYLTLSVFLGLVAVRLGVLSAGR